MTLTLTPTPQDAYLKALGEIQQGAEAARACYCHGLHDKAQQGDAVTRIGEIIAGAQAALLALQEIAGLGA